MTEYIPGRILVVDDNISNLHLLVRMLSKYGHTISVAKSGEEAITLTRKSSHDIILLDIMMPGLDGYTTCEVLKEMPDTRDIPIIFLSALDDIASKTKGFDVGGVDYVSKPFHEAEVIARINTHLSLSLTRRNLESTVEQLSLVEEELRHNCNEIILKDQALQESEETFRTIFSMVPDPILLSRISDGMIIDCNHAMADLIGKPRDEIIGSSTINLKIWKSPEERQENLDKLVKTGGLDREELLWQNNSGQAINILLSSRIIPIKGEKTILSVGFDYTALKKAEQLLKDSEEMYRNPVEQSPVGVFLFQGGVFRYANPRLAMMFGYSRDEFQKISIESLILDPDLAGINDMLQNTENGYGYESHLEFHGVRSSGTILELELFASHMLYQGLPAVYGTIIDVSYRNQIEEARYQSDKKYRLIAENMKDVVCILDYDTWSLRYVSPSIEKLCGYTAEEITTRSISEILTPDTLSCFAEFLVKYHAVFIENREIPGYYNTILNVVCKDGSSIQTEMEISYLTNQKSGNVEVLCVIRDITERLLAETDIERKKQELYKKNEALVAVNKEKEILLKEIHHRVKNNMQVISSLLSMQSRSIQDPTIQSLFLETQTRVRSLSLVHELLYKSDSLKNIEYRKYLLELIHYIINSHNTSRRDIISTVPDYGVEISIEKAVPCSLVVTELLTNTLKYAFPDQRQGKIIIDFQYLSPSNEYVLRYQDNGVGFPQGMDPKSGNGFGSTLIQGLTKQLSGSIILEDGNPGVLYILKFPGDLV